MKILYLHQYFVPPNAPGGTRSYEFARRLVQRGHDVTIVTSSAMIGEDFAAPGKVTRRRLDGIDIVVLPVAYDHMMSYAQRLASFARFAASAAFEVVRQRADVVFATSTPLTIAVPGLLAKMARRIPMVFEVRDLWPEIPIAIGALRNPAARGLARGLEWLAYHGSAEVVALSPGMADGVAKMGVGRDRITVIPNACDVELFSVEPDAAAAFRRETLPQIDPGDPIVLYGGTFGEINETEWLVDVARRLQECGPEVRVVLAGSGRRAEAIRQRAQQLGVLDRNVFMLPPIPKQQVPLLLGCSAVATSTVRPLQELWHNSANKFFDALASGTPVAINYEGWQADVLRETGAGLVLPYDSPRAAAEQLTAFVRSPPARARAASAALALARERFNRDRLTSTLEGVLERAVNAQRAAA